MKLHSLFLIIILQITSIVWAQNDSIPQKNKEAKMHVGAYYAMGLSRFYVDSKLNTRSDIGSYLSYGIMLEFKVYKKLWLELNLKHAFQRDLKINFTQDTFNVDFLIKGSGEATAMLYIKYQILNKKKWSIMTKLGLGIGTFFFEAYHKENSRKQTDYFFAPFSFGNLNYYSFSGGFDINYKLRKHLILFNQVLFNTGINILREPENFRNGSLSRPIHIETMIPQTLIYSLGVKF